jgi:hypothetical protein
LAGAVNFVVRRIVIFPRLVHEAGRLMAIASVIKNDPRGNMTFMNQPWLFFWHRRILLEQAVKNAREAKFDCC